MRKKKAYTPLHIIQRSKELNDLNSGFLSSEFGDENDVLENLPEYMAWATSDAFLKQRYAGSYEKENLRLLAIRREQFSNIPYQRVRTELRDMCVIPGLLKSWDKYRQAYRFDTDFVDELLNTETVKIPVSVFRRLRYPCYYIDMEDDSRFSPFIGFFVYVSTDIETGLPNITVLRVTDPLPDEEDEIIHSAYLTVDDMVKHGMFEITDNNEFSICLGKTHEINNTHRKVFSLKEGYNSYDFEEPNVKQFLMFALQTILYLSSYEPDIQKSTKSIRTEKNGIPVSSPEEKRPMTLSDVGVRYGSAIRVRKKEIQKQIHAREGSHSYKKTRTVTSHMRSAHWHHYWTGPGRTQLIVKWIPPVFVCGNAAELPVTVHDVK